MHVFRVPGYPLALAALFTVVGHDPPVIWGRVLGAALGTLAVGAVMGLTRLLYDERHRAVGGVHRRVLSRCDQPERFRTE